jgi:hypothetical protein
LLVGKESKRLVVRDAIERTSASSSCRRRTSARREDSSRLSSLLVHFAMQSRMSVGKSGFAKCRKNASKESTGVKK